MAGPAAAVGVGLGLLEFGASLYQSELIMQQAEYNAAISELNAERAYVDAYETEKRGVTQAARYQAVINSTIGAQRSQLAAQNVDVSFGTAAQVQADTRVQGFMNQLDMITSARLQARGIRNEAHNYELQADAIREQGRIDRQTTQLQGFFGGLRTGLSGYRIGG